MYEFADSLPEAFYVHGQPLDDANVLTQLVEPYDIDPAEFLHHWQSDTARQAIQVEFARARAAGIKSYPTLWYQREGVVQPVTPGFMLPDEAVNRLAVLRATSVAG